MKLMFLPLITHPLFNQDLITKLFRDYLGSENVLEYNFFQLFQHTFKSDIKLLNENFTSTVNIFQPNVIYMQLQETGLIKPSTLKKIKLKYPQIIISNWTGDIRIVPPPYLVEIGRVIDYTLITSTGQIPLFEKAGCKKVRYLQIGVNTDCFKPLNIARQKTVIFAGSNYGRFPDSEKRMALIKQMKNKFGETFQIYGTGWPVKHNQTVYNDDFNKILNRAYLSIGINAFNDVSHYFSERQLTHMASGTLHVCHYIPGLEKYFKNYKHCVWYHSLDEALNKVEYFLKDENCGQRARIGYAGAEVVRKNHSWGKRIDEYFKIIKAGR